MQRLWLLFAQTVTVGLAIWFIVITLKPDWAGNAADSVRNMRIGNSSLSLQEAGGTSTPGQGSYRDAAKRAMPSVVNIFTTKEAKQPNNPFMSDPFFKKFFGDRFGDEDEKQFSLGSGVLVSPQGFIVTNNHVVEAADEIEVALADGRKTVAKVVGIDPDTDLAVVKVDLQNLPAITLGHSEQARVGDVVLAIGNPFGVGQTVTMGIVSALGRNHLGINTFESFIQTDAAINPGNSGGALIDTNGNLLGINTAIYSRSGGSLGIGFAIPVATVKTVMESIISNGQVVRGYIGVEPQDITPELAESFGLSTKTGAIIAGVVKDGPADKAGIKPGDILVAVEGKAVSDTTEMLNLIAQLTPGNTAKMTVLRKTQQSTVDVTIGKRPRVKREDKEEH
ncbi:MAG TPA: Do family serine endopeptidase [Burkholderiaceae bacterium]|jgi:serine protease DegQ|nr:Do family serine endopeptidase [Burkholderiaceae bacterium]